MGKKRAKVIEEPLLVTVTSRLFAADVKELKRRAAESGLYAWQALLRKLVRDALQRKEWVK